MKYFEGGQFTSEFATVLVLLKYSLHLEFVIEFGSLGVFPHVGDPGVNFSFAPGPINFEIFIEVLSVVNIQKFDIELDLVSLRNRITNMR